jgi:TRAP-type transport system small permease protein
LKRVFAWVDRGVEVAVAVIFAAMCAVGLLQVFNRFVLNRSLSWSEEFQIFAHVWIVFLAIPIAYRRGAHLAVESFSGMLPPKARRVFDVFVELLWIWFAVALAWLAWRVSEVAKLQSSPGLDLPMNYVYYSMVAGGSYLLFVVVRQIFSKAEK